MTESQQDRLARKIEQAKERAERERHEGYLYKGKAGWSYNPPTPPPSGNSVANTPATPPAAPATPPKRSLASGWYLTLYQKPLTPGAYEVAFSDPQKGGTTTYSGALASYWDGNDWHDNADPASPCTNPRLRPRIWWFQP